MDQIEEIRAKTDIIQLISEYLPLKKTGRNFRVLCPFHSEDTPSFIVSPERQIWHCFGACNEGGDIFKFLMKIENIDFGEALRELAKRAGVKLTQYRPSEGEKEKQLLYEINHLAGEFYHYLLMNHPAGKLALNYILGRGINKESLETFRLGFAPNAWDKLQQYLVGKKGYRPSDLEKTGLIIRSEKDKGYYDRFRNRIMFPLKDHRGNICGFAGRVLDPEIKEAKYINTPETLIYHKSDLLYGLFEAKEVIKKADEAIIVEGELDAISSFQVGVRNTIAIKGSALTQNQVQLLSRLTRNIILALDRDLAGDLAAKRGIEVADAVGMSIRVVEIKGGKDPDEIAQKNPQLWQQLVKEAVPVYDYFFDSAFLRYDSQAAEGKRKIGEEIIPVLAKITNEIVRDHYINKLSEELKVNQEAIGEEIKKIGSKMSEEESKKTVISKTTAGEERPRREILEEHLLALAFQAERWSLLRKREVILLVKTPRFIRIIEILGEYLKKSDRFESRRLAKILPSELTESFDRLYLLNLGDLVTSEEKFEKEFSKTVEQLKLVDLKEKLSAIAEEVRQLERLVKPSRTDLEKLETLQRQFSKLSERLGKIGEETP